MFRVYQTVDPFSRFAKGLRGEFDQKFSNPLEASASRFVWDYWHVPEQYTLVRTPAEHFFSRKLYSEFEKQLKDWGRENLGCSDTSPPWLSYYVEGCEQKLHADIPHGPWAFVFSLTNWSRRKFKGGETLMLSENVLNYWDGFQNQVGLEEKDLWVKVPARFNRLLVFDPRIPHGVVPVSGTNDPREARLVIHGWFTQPEPQIVGPHRGRSAQIAIQKFISDLEQNWLRDESLNGAVVLKAKINPNGKIVSTKWLANSLRSKDGRSPSLAQLNRAFLPLINKMYFGARKSSSQITLPLLFQQG
jgi:hypothetical protein